MVNLLFLAIFIISIHCGTDDWIYQTKDLRYFDYSNLYKTRNETFIEYTKKSAKFDIMFNLWRPADIRCHGIPSMAVMHPVIENTDEPIWLNLQTFEPTSRVVSWNAENDEKDHLVVQFRSDVKCYYAPDGTQVLGREDKFFGLDVEVRWDESDTGLQMNITSDQDQDNSDICRPKVTIYSKDGCMMSKTAAFAIFFENNYWAFGLTFIVFGLYNIYYGAKMFKLTIFLFGIFSTVTFAFTLIFIVLEVNSMHQAVIWLILALSIVVGVFIGIFMSRIFRVGVWVIGWWTGLVFALLLDSFTFNKLGITYMLYVLMVIFMAIFGFLAYRYYEYVLIGSSSILGAYFFIRGVSLFIGGYPSEADLFNAIKYGTSSHYVAIPWTFYLYLVTIFILSISGIVLQVKRLNKEQAKVAKKKPKKKKVLKVIKKQKTADTGDIEASSKNDNDNDYMDMKEEEDD